MLEHQRFGKDTLALICEDCVSVIVLAESHQNVNLQVRIRYYDAESRCLGTHVICRNWSVGGQDSYDAIVSVQAELQVFWLKLITGVFWRLKFSHRTARGMPVYELSRTPE